MNFKLSYENAKKLLSVFYSSPYNVSAPFVALLDNLQNEDGDTLRCAIDKEIEALKQTEQPKVAEPKPE